MTWAHPATCEGCTMRGFHGNPTFTEEVIVRLHYRSSDGVYRTHDGRYQIESGVVSTGWCECIIFPCQHGPEGGEIDRHGWWVWDNLRDDYAFDHETWDTMREARHALITLYEREPNQMPARRVKFTRPRRA